MITRRLAIGFVAAALFTILISCLVITLRSQHKATLRKNAAQQRVLDVLSMSRDSLLQRVADADIRIDGDDEFRLQIARALAVIEDNSPIHYRMITNDIRAIQPGPYTWLYPQVNPPVCMIEKTYVTYSPTWTAAILIRFGLHADLYEQFRQKNPTLTVPYSAWTSWKQQKRCLAATIAAMPELGATDREIESLTRYFETWYPERQRDAPDPTDFPNRRNAAQQER